MVTTRKWLLHFLCQKSKLTWYSSSRCVLVVVSPSIKEVTRVRSTKSPLVAAKRNRFVLFNERRTNNAFLVRKTSKNNDSICFFLLFLPNFSNSSGVNWVIVVNHLRCPLYEWITSPMKQKAGDVNDRMDGHPSQQGSRYYWKGIESVWRKQVRTIAESKSIKSTNSLRVSLARAF